MNETHQCFKIEYCLTHKFAVSSNSVDFVDTKIYGFKNFVGSPLAALKYNYCQR